MKPLIQSEAAECGLACLAMVAGHYGLHMDLPQMRRRFPLSLKGLRLNQLIEHAQQLGLNARALRLEMQDLGRLKLPCILHWDLNHFVVLARVGRKKAVLLGPASGRREMDLQEVSRHFTGVALELAPAPQFRPQRAAPAVSLRQLTGPCAGCGERWRKCCCFRQPCRCLWCWRPLRTCSLSRREGQKGGSGWAARRKPQTGLVARRGFATPQTARVRPFATVTGR